jgi:putative two-component system response regulator
VGETTTVLIIDDQASARDVLAQIMERLGYDSVGMEDGRSALAYLESTPPDVVLLDMVLPDINGEAVLSAIRAEEEWKHIPVLVLSGRSDMDSIQRCLEKGADDYIVKPFVGSLLEARVAGCVERKRAHDRDKEVARRVKVYSEELEAKVSAQLGEIASAQLAMIFALSKLAESRDPETGEHLERMREYCRILCQHLRAKDKYAGIIDDAYIENMYSASPLHDIGKVGVPDRILLKPGKLTKDEFDLIKQHTVLGAETLRAVQREFPAISIVTIGIELAESHHERWDGNGYPNGAAGATIPLPARILAVGDVYDAITSKRCYKDAVEHDKCAAIIKEERGAQFDPDVVDAFVAAEEEFVHVRERYQDTEKEFPIQ